MTETPLPSVFNFYLDKSQEVVSDYAIDYKPPRVLKIDCYNEIINQPIPGGISGNLIHTKRIWTIDINTDRILQFNSMYSNRPYIKSMVGDITNMPFEDSYFDIILDLSTIDHIAPENIQKVFSEYYRVLSENGRALIVWWGRETSRTPNMNLENPEDSTYYYTVRDMIKMAKQLFNFLEAPKRLPGFVNSRGWDTFLCSMLLEKSEIRQYEYKPYEVI